MDLSWTGFFSGVFGGIISALITWRIAERRIEIENITQQRATWRDNIRKKSIEVTSAVRKADKDKLNELYTEFAHLLNPYDLEDVAILDLLSKFKKIEQCDNDSLTEFIERVALLLKHDWERAKREAKFWGEVKPCVKCLVNWIWKWIWVKEPDRTKKNEKVGKKYKELKTKYGYDYYQCWKKKNKLRM